MCLWEQDLEPLLPDILIEMQERGLSGTSTDGPDGGMTPMPAPIQVTTLFINSCYPQMEGSREKSRGDQLKV